MIYWPTCKVEKIYLEPTGGSRVLIVGSCSVFLWWTGSNKLHTKHRSCFSPPPWFLWQRNENHQRNSGCIHTSTFSFENASTMLQSFTAAKTEKFLNAAVHVFSFTTSRLSFSLDGQKWRCLETMTNTLTTACWLGLFDHRVAFADSSGSYHMTLRKQQALALATSATS